MRSILLQTVESPQLQSIFVVDIPVMAHRQIPMVVETLQLQHIDKMVDVRCAGPASVGFGREDTVEFPQLQPKWFLGLGRSHACCAQRQLPLVDVLMQFIDLGGRRCDAAATSSSCRPQQLGLGVDFLGPCTQVQGRGSCPHGPHN